MRRKRILFIDDEEIVREALSEVIESIGYDVTVEETGEAGIKAFVSNPDEFDLVLTDLMMLDLKGDVIAERVRTIRPDVPVVLMTGTPQYLRRDDAVAAGVCRVLDKPLTRAELSEEIQCALSRHS